MIQGWGVKCKNPDCAAGIVLSEMVEPEPGHIIFHAMDLKPIRCSICKKAYQYVSADGHFLQGNPRLDTPPWESTE